MQAIVNESGPSYPVTSCGGVNFTKRGWTAVPPGKEAEAEANPFLDTRETAVPVVMELTDDGVSFPVDEVEEIDLSKKTVKELKALAKDREVDGYSKMKKPELLEVLSTGDDEENT